MIALAEEIDDQQQRDRRRVERYEAAAAPYLAEFWARRLVDLPLADAHELLVEIAGRLLPTRPLEGDDADAQ